VQEQPACQRGRALSRRDWPWMQVRVEQVLASAPQLLVCFRLSQLLGFYAETVVQLAGPGAALVATLQTAQARCLLVCCLTVACLNMFTAMALQLLHDMPVNTYTKS
jgi:Conserved oligomeric complex COG6